MISKARTGRDFIARHGETVFNAARRLQGDAPHTPLTRAGFAQADKIGAALQALLGDRPALMMWASPTGCALQTLAVIAEHLGLDWHEARTDTRLVEIGVGRWGGQSYADIGGVLDEKTGLLNRARDGEAYHEIADRVSRWLADTDDDPGDRLVVMHGVSSRMLRGVMTGLPDMPSVGIPVAPPLPQGSVVMIERGVETVVHRGTGKAPA